MTNWIERAKYEISKTTDCPTAKTAIRTLTSVTAVRDMGDGATVAVNQRIQPTAKTAERNLTAVMAVPQPGKSEIPLDIEPDDDSPLRAWTCEEFRDGAGNLQAVKICSAFLQDHLYVVFDSRFVPSEPLALYSTEEIEVMAGKSPGEVMEIHKFKAVLRGRIVH